VAEKSLGSHISKNISIIKRNLFIKNKPICFTVGADEEVSLTEMERIRLLADYIQETKRFDL
jgi:hypothetical protein